MSTDLPYTEETAETCPVCHQPFQGGPRTYTDVYGKERVACDDEHACLDAFTRLPDRKTLRRGATWTSRR